MVLMGDINACDVSDGYGGNDGGDDDGDDDYSNLITINIIIIIMVMMMMQWPTWNLLMSLGLPAFFRQFWLHFMKNFKKNLPMWS